MQHAFLRKRLHLPQPLPFSTECRRVPLRKVHYKILLGMLASFEGINVSKRPVT